jgi:DNA-binding NtrC family response regulator
MHTLLIVEDNLNDRKMLEIMLEPEYRLLFAESLQEAVTVLGSELPSAIVLDLNLPDSRGTSTLKNLMPYVRSAPVVVWSGADDVGEAVRLGASDFVLKNGTLDGLRQAVSRAIVRSKYTAVKLDIKTMQDMLDRERP